MQPVRLNFQLPRFANLAAAPNEKCALNFEIEIEHAFFRDRWAAQKLRKLIGIGRLEPGKVLAFVHLVRALEISEFNRCSFLGEEA